MKNMRASKKIHGKSLNVLCSAILKVGLITSLMLSQLATASDDMKAVFIGSFFEDLFDNKSSETLFSYFSDEFITSNNIDTKKSVVVNQYPYPENGYEILSIKDNHVDVRLISTVCIKAGNCIKEFGKVYRIRLVKENGDYKISPLAQENRHEILFWTTLFEDGKYSEGIEKLALKRIEKDSEREAFINDLFSKLQVLKYDGAQHKHAEILASFSTAFKEKHKIDLTKHKVNKWETANFWHIVGVHGDLVRIDYLLALKKDCSPVNIKNCLLRSYWVKTVKEGKEWKLEPFGKIPKQNFVPFYWLYAVNAP